MTVVERPVDRDTPVELQLEMHRRELTGYCYRMLGSVFEAEDAVQTAFVRAWSAYGRFEGRASLRTWLYRIATNVCVDMLRGKERRFRPIDLGPASPHQQTVDPVRTEDRWLTPVPDVMVAELDGDPAEVAVTRDTIRLAFVTALQALPPRQRAVLILREVLRWQAREVADLLDTSVAAVNSALQRARATLAEAPELGGDLLDPLDVAQRQLLDRYVAAFEAYDIDALLSLLREDAIQSMPPYRLWLQGHEDIAGWYLGHGIGCRGSRLVPTSANGSPAFGQYRADPAGGHAPWALIVLELDGDRIAAMTSFLDTQPLFPRFGLPGHLDREPR